MSKIARAAAPAVWFPVEIKLPTINQPLVLFTFKVPPAPVIVASRKFLLRETLVPTNIAVGLVGAVRFVTPVTFNVTPGLIWVTMFVVVPLVKLRRYQRELMVVVVSTTLFTPIA